jgi:tRNA threonylcarbamoyladenosine biosynthesis protein TsaE
MTYESHSPEQTQNIAKDLAKNAAPGDIFLLKGDLGAGKTAFAKGFALGLGITSDVVSPTFAILNVYSGDIMMYHFDLYRLGDLSEFYGAGLEEYIFSEGVSIVEWPDIIEGMVSHMPGLVTVLIVKDINKGDEYRKITVESGVKP